MVQVEPFLKSLFTLLKREMLSSGASIYSPQKYHRWKKSPFFLVAGRETQSHENRIEQHFFAVGTRPPPLFIPVNLFQEKSIASLSGFIKPNKWNYLKHKKQLVLLYFLKMFCVGERCVQTCFMKLLLFIQPSFWLYWPERRKGRKEEEAGTLLN